MCCYQVSELQQTQALMVASQEELGASFQLELEKARGQEDQLRKELHLAQVEVGNLRSEVTAGRSLLDQANETMVIKVFQIIYFVKKYEKR